MQSRLISIKHLLLLFLLTGFTSVNAGTRQDTQLWMQFVIQGTIKDNFIGFFELQPRVDNHVSQLSTSLMRTALGYKLNDNISIWQGYAWTPLLNPTFRNEHRPFQQLLITNKFNNLTLTNRTRLEERLLQGASGISFRLRHLLGFNFPISNNPRWFAVLSDEVFFNLNSVENGPSAGFNQNRFYLGLGYRFNSPVSVQAGYMLKYINISSSINRLDQVALLSCTLTFN